MTHKNNQLFLLFVLLISTHLQAEQVISLNKDNAVFAVEALADNTFAASSHDGNIRIFDINADTKYDCSAELTGHTKDVTSLAKLNDSTFVSGSADTTLRIWQKGNDGFYTCASVLTDHTSSVQTVTRLEDNSFISVAHSGVAIVWQKNKDEGYNFIMKLTHVLDTATITGAIKLNDFGFAITGSNNDITLYKRLNNGSYKFISRYYICLSTLNSLIQLDNGNIIAGCSGYRGMLDTYPARIQTLIPISNGDLRTGPQFNACSNIRLVKRLCNNNFASLAYGTNEIKIWKPCISNLELCFPSQEALNYNHYQHKATLKGHDLRTEAIVQLNNGHIVSGSLDGTIIIWTEEDLQPV